MRTTRRNFLKLMAASGAGTVAFAGCAIPELELAIQAPVTPPEDLLQGFDAWYATQCSQCTAGCGLIVRVIEGRAKKVEGNPDHPLNVGKSCVRSQATVQGVYHPDRITNPLRRRTATTDRLAGAPEFEAIKWEEAISQLTQQLRGATEQDAVVMITEPLNGHAGLVSQRFAQGVRAQHLALEPMEASVEREAIRRVYGTDQLPDFDVRNADVVVSFGADWLSTWWSPVQYGKDYGDFRQGRAGHRGLLFHAESRHSMTAAAADKWLPIRPGTEGILAYSIASAIVSRNFGGDRAAITAINQGGALDEYLPERVARSIGVDASVIYEIAEKFAKATAPLAIGGGPAAAQTNGLFNLVAIHSLNVLMGNIGKPGGVHLNPAPVGNLPANAGGATLPDWVRLADRLAKNQVKVVMVHGANPVYELPNALDFRGALARAPFIVSFSTFMDETTAMADLILPDNHPLESWGSGIPTPGPGYQTITFQQPAIKPQLDTRSTADVLLGLAKDLGISTGLPWASLKQAVQETAEDLWRTNRGSITAPAFDTFWYGVLQRGGWWDTNSTVQGARITPVAAAASELAEWGGDEVEFPYSLVPYQSNALGAGEGANLPWLQAAPDPMTTATWQTWVEINPEVARKLHVEVGDLVRVTTPQREVVLPAYINPSTPPETLAIPQGQGHWQYGRWAYNRGVNPMTMVEPVEVKPVGGLAWAATRAKLEKATGRKPLPLMEGDLGGNAVAAELHQIVQITRM